MAVGPLEVIFDEQQLPPHLLVLGVDGSGKSTFLQGVRSYGYEILEPTGTPESRAFKAAHIDTPVDEDFISQRQELFLALNEQFGQTVTERLRSYGKLATTGNALVTHVSHEVMRQTITSKADYAGKALLWLEASSDSKPDGIILIHAPMEVIMKRIQGRQEKGDTSEKFWGFNAPLFLHAYQEAWKRTLSILETHAIPILSMDSSVLSPTRMLHLFTERYARNTTKE